MYHVFVYIKKVMENVWRWSWMTLEKVMEFICVLGVGTLPQALEHFNSKLLQRLHD